MARSAYLKVAQRDGFIYKILHDIFTLFRYSIRVPPVKIIYGPLSFLHFWGLLFFRGAKKILFDEPIFRYRCKEVGKNLTLFFKCPLLTPNLNIYIGNDCSINGFSTFSAPSIFESPSLIIGDGTSLGYEVTINVGNRVEIGSNCLIADRVFISDNNGHPTDPKSRIMKLKVPHNEIKPVKIGNNVWIGYQSVILKGVNIGDGSIIGANSVVVNDIPPNTVVLGNPARQIMNL